MRTQAPVQERDSAAPQPSAHKADKLRATAERIDDLLTDAKSALDRLMTSAAPDDRTAAPSRRRPETATTAMVADLLLEEPGQGNNATNEFESLEIEVLGEEATAADATPLASEPNATDSEPMHASHHDQSPTTHDDGRGVFALAMVSMSMLVAAALFGQHYAGIGVVGGANLLAWLVVVQQRREARAAAAVAH